MPSCLLVVSHPDDDAIFAGGLQSRMSALDWTVVVVTHRRDCQRGHELLAWQDFLSTDPGRIHFLGHRDDPDDWLRRRCSLDEDVVATDLGGLELSPDLVVTHNRMGEYRHPHHRLTHRVVRRVFPTVPTLLFGLGLPSVDFSIDQADRRERLLRFFPSQREAIARVARAAEAFAWDDAVPPSSALLAACRLQPPVERNA